MELHDFVIVEKIPELRVAVHETAYPADDRTDHIDIGPLFPLFTASAKLTCAKETGESGESSERWMGPTRFHLPPTIRWFVKVGLAEGIPDRSRATVGMACSDRVQLAEYADVRRWPGGCFAAAESRFDVKVAKTWQGLLRMIEQHGMTVIGKEVLIENLQATNHGGWDRYRVLLEVDGEQLAECGWVV